MKKQKLIDSFQTNTWLIKKHAEGMTHDESLQTLPIRSNNFNWVLGHIVVSRDGVLSALSEEPFVETATKEMYASGSEPATIEKSLPLKELLAMLDTSMERITAVINNAPIEALNAPYGNDDNTTAAKRTTVADRIAGLNWHETYHVGQLEILRQVGSEKPAFP